MERMDKIVKLWDNGEIQTWLPSTHPTAPERTIAFRKRRSAERVLQLMWKFAGVQYSCAFPAVVIPDLTGVVLIDEWHTLGAPRVGSPPWQRHLRVLNPDASLRLRIYPPRLDERSVPSSGWIELPMDFSQYGITFGAPASDGFRNAVVEFDWKTGGIQRWIEGGDWFSR
jgi:hypothetical protein